MGVNNMHTTDGIGTWGGGFIGGLVAGIAMGLVLHFGANLVELLGGLIPGTGVAVAVGWTVHLTLSVVFGLLFAAVASRPMVQEQVTTFTDYVIGGLLFGAVLGLFAGGLLFPVAMQGAGIAAFPLPFLPVPGVAGELLSALVFALGHLVYGLVLGAVFATINGVAPVGLHKRVPLVR